MEHPLTAPTAEELIGAIHRRRTGDTMPRPTAETLVSEFLDLLGLAPKIEGWRARDAFVENPPRRLRLLRLRAMFSALGLAWDPAGFPSGRAVDVTDARHVARLEQIEVLTRGHAVERRQLDVYFEILFAYRTRLDACLRFSGGVLEASGAFLAAHLQVGVWNDALGSLVSEVDGLLGSLLDPAGRVFAESELVRDHGFPTENVFDAHLEWM